MADRISLSAPFGSSIELLDDDRDAKYREDGRSDDAQLMKDAAATAIHTTLIEKAIVSVLIAGIEE